MIERDRTMARERWRPSYATRNRRCNKEEQYKFVTLALQSGGGSAHGVYALARL